MAEQDAHYNRGHMDIAEQVSTFHGFINMSKWGSLAIATGVLFFSLLLCAHAAFFQAAGAAIVLVVAGVLMLGGKKSAGH